MEKEQRRGREAIPELEACIAFTAYGLWRKERNCRYGMYNAERNGQRLILPLLPLPLVLRFTPPAPPRQAPPRHIQDGPNNFFPSTFVDALRRRVMDAARA